MAFPETVLVVDDDEAMRNILLYSLKRDFRVVVASDGLEGMCEYEQNVPNIVAVVTDLEMPQVSGDVFIRWLREFDAELPIVLLTGSEGTEELLEQLSRLRVEVMRKPFQVAHLVRQIRLMAAGFRQAVA